MNTLPDPRDPRTLFFNPFFESNVVDDIVAPPPQYDYIQPSHVEKVDGKISNVAHTLSRMAVANDDFQLSSQLRSAPLPPIYDSIENIKAPQAPLITASGTSDLLITGQGTIAVLAPDATELLVCVSNDDDPSSLALYFYLSTSSFAFFAAPAGTKEVSGFSLETVPMNFTPQVVKSEAVCYIRADQSKDRPDTYWFSIDKKNGVLRYGKGYLNVSLTLLQAELTTFTPGAGEGKGVAVWKDSKYKFIESLKRIRVYQNGTNFKMASHMHAHPRIAIQPLPIVQNLPPFLVTKDAITLQDLADGKLTVAENLDADCQRLYYNVAGPNIILDSSDFADFSKAIERSCSVEGCIGYKLLDQKAGEFGGGQRDFNGTYLRITLGMDLGNSPGPPYVVEIWPAGHYSPIHDHAGAYAIIKVLHGTINAFYYNSLTPPTYQLGPPAVLNKGDVTWLSPECYQIHKLYNPSKEGKVCVTIQCYSYAAKDATHDPDFHFLANTSNHSQSQDGSKHEGSAPQDHTNTLPRAHNEFDYLPNTDANSKKNLMATAPSGQPKRGDDIHGFKPNTDMTFTDFKSAIRREWDEFVKGGGVWPPPPTADV